MMIEGFTGIYKLVIYDFLYFHQLSRKYEKYRHLFHFYILYCTLVYSYPLLYLTPYSPLSNGFIFHVQFLVCLRGGVKERGLRPLYLPTPLQPKKFSPGTILEAGEG